jgi:type II secretory pathway component PulF
MNHLALALSIIIITVVVLVRVIVREDNVILRMPGTGRMVKA